MKKVAQLIVRQEDLLRAEQVLRLVQVPFYVIERIEVDRQLFATYFKDAA